MSPIRPWVPVLGATAISLLCLVAAAHTGKTTIDLAPLPAPIHVRGTDVADLGAELSAPLFAPSRTVITPGANPATPPAPPPQLTGVVLGGGRAVALVKGASGADTLMLHVGDTIDGWTIVEIAKRQIIVSRDGARQAVALDFDAKAAEKGGEALRTTSQGNHTAGMPSFDGLSAAKRLGLPASNIPLGSPLAPPR